MTRCLLGLQRSRINRRAFLRATSGVALGLPFLASLPGRSAWACGQSSGFQLAQARPLLRESRKSMHDLVREDLRALMGNSRMSSVDRQGS